jgi:aryl-alcohol dehydrogenase-like predicted oxidoreductase
VPRRDAREYQIFEDEATAGRLMDRFIERGGNFIDTANIYTGGHSEQIIGNHIGRDPAKRDRIVLATKFGGNMHRGDPNGGGANRKSIVSNCEASLRRLQTDYIDLYWMHWEDPFTPVEETIGALNALVEAERSAISGSRIRMHGSGARSDVAEFRGWAPLIAL